MTSPSTSDTHVLCSAVRGSGRVCVPFNRAPANPRGRSTRWARFQSSSRRFGTSARTQRPRPGQRSKPTVYVACVSRSHVKSRKQLFFLGTFAFMLPDCNHPSSSIMWCVLSTASARSCDACRVHFLPGCWAVAPIGIPHEQKHGVQGDLRPGTLEVNLILSPGSSADRGSVRMNTNTT